MTTRRAYTLVELMIVIAIIALLIAVFLPGLAESRRVSRAAICITNLRQHATATQSYAADYGDRIWTFSWTAGRTYSQYPDLQGAETDLQAAADQAVDTLRRRADRPDMPRMLVWIPHIRFSHLVLMDYFAARLPERILACPEDRSLVRWQGDPGGFDQGALQPQPDATTPNAKRYPYGTTYLVAPCIFDPNDTGLRICQCGGTSDSYWVHNDARLSPRRLDQVRYSAQKMHLYDRHQRHASRKPFFGLKECSQPLLAFDGSVQQRRTSETNPGWQPNDPTSAAPTPVWYGWQPWEPPTISGTNQDYGIGHYRWTRGGLAGIDWGGAEIDTGQPR